MRILIIAPFFPPDRTGSSIFAAQQARVLASMGHEVMVISNYPERSRTKPDVLGNMAPDVVNVRLVRVRSLRISLGTFTWGYKIPISFFGMFSAKLWKLIREFHADIVINHSTLFDLNLVFLLWSYQTKTKCLVVAHSALWHENKFMASGFRLFGKAIIRPLIKASGSSVVAVDKWTYTNAVEIFSQPETTFTIPVSIPRHSMKGGDARQVRLRHGIEEGPILLSLGHVVPVRDRVNLVRALPLILRKYPTLKVLIVGMIKTWGFMDLAKTLGVDRSIVLVGSVPHAEIRDYLALADIELHDLNGLGLGITSVEAMDAGVPIVAWVSRDNYPQHDLFGFGSTGFIHDGSPETIASMVDQLLADGSFRSTVIDTQYKIVDQIYSELAVNSEYLQIAMR